MAEKNSKTFRNRMLDSSKRNIKSNTDLSILRNQLSALTNTIRSNYVRKMTDDWNRLTDEDPVIKKVLEITEEIDSKSNTTPESTLATASSDPHH